MCTATRVVAHVRASSTSAAAWPSLGPSLGDDAWRQWWAEWAPDPGTHEIEVRAVTAAGLEQTGEKRSAFPNGASGLHTSHVRVVPPG